MRSRRLRSIVLAGCALAGFAANSSAQFVASWTSATSGTWTNAANWSTNPVFPNNNSPAVGDTYDAVIDAIGPAYTVTLDSAVTLNSLHLNSPSATLQHVSGTLQLLNSSTISSGIYSLSNGTILGPGTITISNGGVLEIPASGRGTIGTVVDNHGLAVLNNSTLTLANGTFNNHNTLVLGSANRAVVNSTGASVLHNTGTIIASTSFTLIGEVMAPFVNSGTIIGINGRTRLSNGTHNVGSTIAGDAAITLEGTHFLNGNLNVAGSNVEHPLTLTGPGDMDVIGTLQWFSGTMSGSGASHIRAGARISQPSFTPGFPRVLSRVLNNEGTISLTAGTLQMAAGTLNNLATGVIEFSLSSDFGSSGSTNLVSNAGTIRLGGTSSTSFRAPLVNSGTILINNNGLFVNSAATFNGDSYIGGTGTFDLSGANKSINGRLMMAPRSAVLSGTLLVNGTLDIATAAQTTSSTTFAGASSGVINVLPGASSNGSFTLSRIFNNSGIVHVGSTLSGMRFSNGTFNNLAGGLFIADGGGISEEIGTSNSLTNAGTLFFSGQTGTGQIVAPIINSGTIHATGPMRFSTTVTHVAGSTILGDGSIGLGGGTHHVNGTLTLAGSNINATGGTLTGAGNIELTGVLNYINGGPIVGPGSLNVAPGATLNLLAPGSSQARVINNFGVISTGSFNGTISAGTINNPAGSVIRIGQTASLSFATTVFNSGTILFDTGSGSATLSAGWLFNRGSVMASSGTTILSGSNHSGDAVVGGPAPIILAGIWLNSGPTLAGSNMTLNGTMNGQSDIFMQEGASFLTGTLHWNSGSITQSGSTSFPIALHVRPGGVLNAVGFGARAIGRSIRNEGMINFNGASTSWSGGTITNLPGGVMNIAALTSSFSTERLFSPPAGSQFINYGTFILASPGTLNIGPASFTGQGSFTNSSGTIIVNSGSVGVNITKAEGNSYIGGAGTAVLGVATLNGSLALDGKSVWNQSTATNGTGSLLVNHQTFVQQGDFRNIGGVHIAPDAEFYVGLSAQTFGTATVRTTIQNAGFTRILNGRISSGVTGGVGTFNNLATGILNLADGAAFEGNVTLNNAGRVDVSIGTINITSPLNNTGTLAINAGSTALTGTIAQLQDSTLTGGNWLVGPVAQLHLAAGTTISLNQANVELLSPFAHFPALNALQENSGTLSLRLGRSFTAAGSFTNSGVINIDNGGALFVNDALFNSGTINGLVIQTGSSTLSGNSYIKTLRGGDVFVETSAAARVDYLDAAALSIASQADLTLGAGSIAHVIDVLNIAPAAGTLFAGRLDLLSGRLVIDYTSSSPADAVSQLLATGFNNGDWLGRGITSSSILASSNFAIGMIESAEIFSMGGTFAGVNVDNTALLLDRTLKGDANLDYTVNISDFAIVAANFNTPTKWSKGDFNYDGVTNIADFALLAANFNQSVPVDLPRHSIPEPAVGAFLAIATLASRRNWRK